MITYRTFGELLIQAGVINASALNRALEVQKREGVSLGRALASLTLADEEAVTAAIAQGMQLEYLGAEPPEVAPEIAALLSIEFCHNRQVAPLTLERHTLRLAMVNPLDYATIQDVEFITRRTVVAVVASESSINALLLPLEVAAKEEIKTYNLLANVTPTGELEAASATEYEITDAAKLAQGTKLPPVVRLVNLILSDAAKAGASDIHVEPQETFLQIRQRVDGLLHDALQIPKDLQDPTISRLKIISGMDIAERRRPQDGRSRLRFEGKRIDLRVSTLPTQFGEKVVIRLLDFSKTQITIEEIGLTSDNLRLFQSWLTRPQGMILVTGPTGSGKTSTLYTALTWLKSPTNNIVTVEDPIEYNLPGINQVQINTRTDMTFAAGLRSILRQDPNIILVGEIRDQETAGIALEAAQTGHLLLSTLHTNDAPSTITRLLDLGCEPFLVASSVTGILAQRLVRRHCPACSIPQPPSSEAVEKVGGTVRLPMTAQWIAGQGCSDCRESGYKGRLAIQELLTVTDEMRELIFHRASEHMIREVARRSGLHTMMEDGIAKAAQGLTTLEEVVRVVAQDEAPPANESARPVKEETLSSALAEHTEQKLANQQSVLIVEDSPTIVSVVKYFLELEGFKVLVAEDGLSGLDIVRHKRPDLIVSDINMPGLNGIEMVKALRADPLTRATAILMLTCETSIESEEKSLAIGADDYLRKPVEPRQLAAHAKALLRKTTPRHSLNMSPL